jgi:hypothetical protein
MWLSSCTPRDYDSRSLPYGNLFDALSHDDASVSSASSQDQPEPMFSVGSCVYPAESIKIMTVFFSGVYMKMVHFEFRFRVMLMLL